MLLSELQWQMTCCVSVFRRDECGWLTWTRSGRSQTRCCSAGRSWRPVEKSPSIRSAVTHVPFQQTDFFIYWTATVIYSVCVCVCMQEGPAFRYTTSEVTVQPSPCLSYRIPRDFVDLSTGEDAYKLIDFLKLVGCSSSFTVFCWLCFQSIQCDIP